MRISKGISTRQVIAILASTLALFFLVAFAIKSVDAYRLRSWRDQLQSEIADMERQRDELQRELERRQSASWVEQVLRDAGKLPEGVVAVVPVPLTPSPMPTVMATPEPPAPAGPDRLLFDNPNWTAWKGLIWEFD